MILRAQCVNMKLSTVKLPHKSFILNMTNFQGQHSCGAHGPQGQLF